MKHTSVIVSDHALVRYIERVLGVDVDALRRRIESDTQTGVNEGANGVRADGVIYRISGCTVTTCHIRDPKPVRRQTAYALKGIRRKDRVIPLREELEG